MKGSKLITILSVLSKDELKGVRKMLKSAYFTSNNTLLSLFELLYKQHPEFNNPVLAKKTAYKKLFKTDRYSDVKMRNLMRDLTRILEQWLVLDQLRKKPYDRRKHFADALLERSLIPLHEQETKKLQDKLSQYPDHGASYYKKAIELNDLMISALPFSNAGQQKDLLVLSNDLLEKWYQIRKISIACKYQTLTSVIKTDAVLKSPELIQKQLAEENILYQLYRDTISLYQNNDIELFYDIKDSFIQHLDQLIHESQLTLILVLLNYAIGEMKKDDKQFNPVVFELYQVGLRKNLLIHHKRISSIIFTNIVITGAKEKAFDWISTFMKEYTIYLNPAKKTDILAICNIHISFHKRAFEEAISKVNQHSFSIQQLDIGARILSIRCAYEMFLENDSYFDFYENSSLTLERFIRRNDLISQEYKTAMLHFTLFLRKLAKERNKGKLGAEAQSTFISLLESQEITISRSWLKDKISQ